MSSKSKSKLLLENLTKESFIKQINESRKEEGQSVKEFAFNKNRVRVVSKVEEIKENSNGILYWMSRDCRVQDNWSFLFAQRLALKHKLPLFVCILTKDCQFSYPTLRHLRFAIEGFKAVEKECAEKNIGFYLLKSGPKDLVTIVKDNNIGGIVYDQNPLKKPKEWRDIVLENLPKDVPLIEVDAHNIVPVWIAADKQQYMAKVIRPRITKHLPEYLTGFPDVTKHPYTGKIVTKQCLRNVEDVIDDFKPIHNVDEVKWAIGGPEAGFNMLFSFLRSRVQFYGVSSNDPSKNHTSNLSPWIRFGHMSAQRIAIEVKKFASEKKEQTEKYLEELIIRRELAENYCYYNENYDNINGAPDWALKSLKEHKSDKRVYKYTKKQFEDALTHDEMWNAAQLQLVQEGKIHGYMRMYWCKKILEWTESPEQAIEYGLWFNDTFSLDGTDPNGFVGIMWSICGVHDQGWREREIFGKIRFMVDYSLKKKYDMDAYCARFGRSVGKVGPAKKKLKTK